MPLALVVVCVFTDVRTLVAVTVAFGTTAPLGSVTVPLMDPVMVWAYAGRHAMRKSVTIRSRGRPDLGSLRIGLLEVVLHCRILARIRLLDSPLKKKGRTM